jgi:hypothetical protein
MTKKKLEWCQSSRAVEALQISGIAPECVPQPRSRRHGGPFVVRRRSGQLRPALRPPFGESPVCGSTGFGGFPTAGFRRAPGTRRLWTARRDWPGDQWWRTLMRRSEGLGCVSCDGSDGKGLSGSAPTFAAHNTCLPRRGLRPLATAGEVVGLRERRWTALRRPDGRLSGRR